MAQDCKHSHRTPPFQTLNVCCENVSCFWVFGRKIAELLGHPCMVVPDNGTKLTSNAMLKWHEDRQVRWHYIKTMQNGSVESFCGRMRKECLNEHLFSSLRHACSMIAARHADYNHNRPHSSFDGLPPWEYHQRSGEDQTLNSAN